jgi:hypothetical protein
MMLGEDGNMITLKMKFTGGQKCIWSEHKYFEDTLFSL